MLRVISALILLSISVTGCTSDCGNEPFLLDGKRPSEVFQNPKELELLQAALCEDDERVKQLVEQGVDIDAHSKNGFTPLGWTVVQQDEVAVAALLANGSNPNEVIFFPETARNAEVEPTPIYYAATRENEKIIERLINAGAEVNYVASEGESPLIGASRSADVDSVRWLLEAGADPNVVLGGVMSAGTSASSMEGLEALNILLDYGYCALLPKVLSLLENRRDSVSKSNPKMDLLLKTIDRVEGMIASGKGC